MQSAHEIVSELVDRLRYGMEALPQPACFIDTNQRIRHANASYLKQLGYSPEQVIGHSLSSVIGAAQHAQLQPHIARALAGEPVLFEQTPGERDSASRYTQAQCTPVRAADDVAGVLWVQTDINDVKAREVAASERERIARRVVDSIGIPLAYLDGSRRFQFVNAPMREMWGQRGREMLGSRYDDALDPTLVRYLRPLIERVFRGEAVLETRELEWGGNGMRYSRVCLIPEAAQGGHVVGVFCVVSDIDDDHQLKTALVEKESQLRAFTESIPELIAYVDNEHRYRFVNKRFAEIQGATPQDIIGRKVWDVIGQDRWAHHIPYVRQSERGEAVSYEYEAELPGQGKRWFNVKLVPEMGSNNEWLGHYLVANDIHDLKVATAALEQAKWITERHFDNSPLAVVECDTRFHITRWSSQAEHMFGYTSQEMVGQKFGDTTVLSVTDRDLFSTVMSRLSFAESKAVAISRMRRADGSPVWVEWYHSALFDSNDHIISMLSLGHDITSRVLAEERLEHLATHDLLTGLPNRAKLEERLHHALARARRAGGKLATLFIDLDHFKEVNDQFGHRVGDELLKRVARRIKSCLRETDFLVRFAGDEFVIMTEDVTDRASAIGVANRILARVRQPMEVDGHQLQISASAGLCLYPEDAGNTDEMLRNSDLAMYRAKEGRDRVQPFTPEIEHERRSRREFEEALKHAIELREMHVAYQPILDLPSRNVGGVEALLRWTQNGVGLRRTDELIRVAESNGLIVPITEFVLQRAVEQAAEWRRAHSRSVGVSVNLSGAIFRMPHLAERVFELLEDTGVEPSALTLEITETSVLADLSAAVAILERMRRAGVRVALDDFGTGYSSLAYLRQLPVDIVKIDRSFTAPIVESAEDREIVRAVIGLAHALEVKVVAEGVETEAQCTALQEMGCDAIQGHLICPPCSATELSRLLVRQS